MIDISSVTTGLDLGMYDTQAPKAGNVLSVQLGSLEYQQDFGIDLNYFLQENLRFENASFVSYLIEVLANNGINVASTTEVVQNLFRELNINVKADDTTTALIAR